MTAFAPDPKSFDLKSTAWTLTALRLHSADVARLDADLAALVDDSPGLFDDDALVLDLSLLRDGDNALDFGALLPRLRRHGLCPLAVQGGSPAQTAAARAAGLAEAPEPAAAAPRPRDARPSSAAPAASPAPDATASPAEAAAPTTQDEPRRAAAPTASPEPARDADASGAAAASGRTLVVDTPLRSGQRVYARGGDLVVRSVVNFGAEVIADGHIHVYGPLRGRAIAGARGDTGARIFATCMEPQLVAIAGIYRTTETPLADDVAGKPAQVRLDGERLIVEPLQA